MQATISRWGNSLALRIPKAAAEAAHLSEGDVVEIDEDSGTLRIARTGRIDVDAMISAITPENLNIERAFIDAPPAGREIL